MALMTISWIVCIIVALGYYFYNRGKPKEGGPPGPLRLPLVGNAHKMGRNPTNIFSQWAKEFGPIYSAQLGPLDMVVLNDAKILKEAYANPIFNGKPSQEAFTIFSGGKYGIIATDDEVWTEQRRFTVRHLRDMGMGKNTMEELIMEEVNEFIHWLKKEEGNPVILNNKFSLAVLNSLWMIVHGKRYPHDDPRLNEIFNIHHDAVRAVSASGVLFWLSWFAKTFPNASGWQKMWDLLGTFHGFFRESIVEHQATLGDDSRDFVDAYLNEMKAQAKSSTSSFNEENGMKNLLAVLGDLFMAGYETTSITLTWLFLYLSLNPRVLKKMQEEIDSTVGKSRQPNLADRPKLVYTEAVIQELLRITSIGPLGVFHTATQNTEFHNFKIPKDTLIASNLYFIHHNPEIWGDPEVFRPERFLSEDGKTLVKNENLVPFSTGKHVCPGESLARDELFLFSTNICQRFDVMVDPAKPNPSLEPEFLIFLSPKPYSVIMKDRF